MSRILCTAIDHKSNLKWQVPYGDARRGNWPESRCTPTTEDDRIYVLSGTGQVVCLSTKRGEKIWSVDAYRKFEGREDRWGLSECLLLVDVIDRSLWDLRHGDVLMAYDIRQK